MICLTYWNVAEFLIGWLVGNILGIYLTRYLDSRRTS